MGVFAVTGMMDKLPMPVLASVVFAELSTLALIWFSPSPDGSDAKGLAQSASFFSTATAPV